MKNVTKALVLAGALIAARAESAGTADFLIHGNSCVSTTPGVSPIYTQWGPYNPSSTSAMMLSCPVPFPNHNYTSGYMQVSAWTRNTGDQVFCNYAGTDNYGGNLTYVQAKVPYSGGGPNLGTASLYLTNSSDFLYVTCHIPMATGNGYSYLSTIYVSGNY